MTIPLQRSPLHDSHIALGGKLVPFAGWEMPVQYRGIMEEHKIVRQSVGIFDISHMGQFHLRGPGIAEAMDRRLTNRASSLGDGHGQYTLLLNEKAGIIDDLIIYRITQDHWFLVVNASRINEDAAAIQENLPGSIQWENASATTAGFAIQGPASPTVWKMIFPETPLPERNGIASATDDTASWIVCRTGYTGEDGYEFFCPATEAVTWFDRFVTAIQAVSGQPCGLGARDSLRLEMGYPLYGQDLDENHTPLQAGLGFFVDLDKPEFVGRDVLVREKENGPALKLVALEMIGTSPPPRHDYPVLQGESPISVITSGGFGPSVGKGIAMAYLPAPLAKRGQEVTIDIRGRMFPAKVVKKPFYQRPASPSPIA